MPTVLPTDFLLSLLKAGGLSALSIGVVCLIYWEIVRRDVFPKLRQWQAFVLLCLIAILVFAIAMTVLLRRENVASARDQLVAIAKEQDRALYARIKNLVFNGTSQQCREFKGQIETFGQFWGSAKAEDYIPVTTTQTQLNFDQKHMTADYEQRHKALDRAIANARTLGCL